MMPIPPKKNPLSALELITDFFLLDDLVRPLSTPCPPADNNKAADKYQNQANKVGNGDHFFLVIESDWIIANL